MSTRIPPISMQTITMLQKERRQVLAALSILMDAYQCQEENGGPYPSMFSEGEDGPFYKLAGAKSSDTLKEQGRLGMRWLLDNLALTSSERAVMDYPLRASLAGNTSLLKTDSETDDCPSPAKKLRVE